MHGAVKTSAALDAELVSSHSNKQQSWEQKLLGTPEHPAAHDGQAAAQQHAKHADWHHQGQQQRGDPARGPDTSHITPTGQPREHGHVKFASAGSGDYTASSCPTPAAGQGATGADDATDDGHVLTRNQQQQRQQQQQQFEDESNANTARSSRLRLDGEAAAAGSASSRPGFFSRVKKSLGESMKSRSGHAADGSSNRLTHIGSGVSQPDHQQDADWQDDPSSLGPHGAKSQAQPSHSAFSASFKGFLGGASSRLLGSLMGRASSSSKGDADEEEEEELWFTSLDDFKPICHMLHRGRYMTAYFACANKTGQHFLLKKYDKHKMVPAEERGVRRAIAFSELLQHPNLVRCVGQWEEADTIYVVEEYAGKGDIFNDCISHPEKYTERHVAVVLVKPLLKGLAYLHANNIIHRCVLPENLYMGIDDVLRLGHLTLSVDQLSDRPKSRTALLDYMAPEMLSVKPHNEHELALGLDDSEEGEEEGMGLGSGEGMEVKWRGQQLQQEGQVLMEQVVGSQGPAAAAAAAEGQQGSRSSIQQQQQLSSKQLQHQQQQQHAGPAAAAVQQQVQQAARLESSQAASPEPYEGAVEVASRSSSCRPRSRGVAAGAAGQAEWEYLDYYDEKVDIWQVGCMVHELLCGSMPFEVDNSKLDSAGLALWADIEQPPGSLPPDCTNFLQLALTKDPKQRPSAEQLLTHPWLARCEAGEPWRDPAELEAARKAAELATVLGWLRHNGRALLEAVKGLAQHAMHSGRVQPLLVDPQQQQGLGGGPLEFLPVSGPSSPSLAARVGSAGYSFTSAGMVAMATAGNSVTAGSSAGTVGALGLRHGSQSSPGTLQYGGSRNSAEAGRVSPVPPLKLTEEVVGRLNAGWVAPVARASEAPDEDDGESFAAACVVTTSNVSCTALGSKAVSTSVSPSKGPESYGALRPEQQLVL